MGTFGGKPVSGNRQKKGNDGNVSIPSIGPRAKAVGAKECGKSNYPSRGTNSPVK